jgi:hypothetical protein
MKLFNWVCNVVKIFLSTVVATRPAITVTFAFNSWAFTAVFNKETTEIINKKKCLRIIKVDLNGN